MLEEFDSKKIFNQLGWKLFDWVGKKNRKLGLFFIGSLFIVFLIGTFIIPGLMNVLNLASILKPRTAIVSPTATPSVVLAAEDSIKIEDIVDTEKVRDKCDGAQFDIINQLTPVGGEAFSFPYTNDDHIASVASTVNYQGSYKTVWGCNLPFVITLRAVPVTGQSLGLFVEIENILKVIVGDGDRKFMKLQRNKLGLRDEWEEVFRNQLSNLIEDNKEVILKVFLKQSGKNIKVRMEVYYSGKTNPDWFEREIEPGAINLTVDKEIGVRVGVNDSLYKGLGSNVRLETLSIIHQDW